MTGALYLGREAAKKEGAVLRLREVIDGVLGPDLLDDRSEESRQVDGAARVAEDRSVEGDSKTLGADEERDAAGVDDAEFGF